MTVTRAASGRPRRACRSRPLAKLPQAAAGGAPAGDAASPAEFQDCTSYLHFPAALSRKTLARVLKLADSDSIQKQVHDGHPPPRPPPPRPPPLPPPSARPPPAAGRGGGPALRYQKQVQVSAVPACVDHRCVREAGGRARVGGGGGGQLLPSRRSRPPPRPGSAAEDHPWLFKELRCGTCRAQAAVLCSRAWRFGRGPGNACTRLTCFA